MKITKKQLTELIKEEVNRQKTLMELNERKYSILKKLNEMDYGVKETEEELLDEGNQGNIKRLTDEFWKRGKVWYSKKIVSKPTQEKLDTILSSEIVANDNYEGKIGHSKGEMAYIPSKEIKWGLSTHTFGSGT